MPEAYIWPRVVQLWGQEPSPHVQPRILPVGGAPSPPATIMRFYAHARPIERVGASDKLASLTRGHVVPMLGSDGIKTETSGNNAAEGGSAPS